MHKYSGSCHCGKVQIEVRTDLQPVLDCNCSICVKKGALHHRVSSGQFKIISGEECLVLYQFNTKTAKHYFCKYCGIHPFSRPRAAPDMYSVNIKCLDIDLESANVEVVKFDGKKL